MADADQRGDRHVALQLEDVSPWLVETHLAVDGEGEGVETILQVGLPGAVLFFQAEFVVLGTKRLVLRVEYREDHGEIIRSIGIVERGLHRNVISGGPLDIQFVGDEVKPFPSRRMEISRQ